MLSRHDALPITVHELGHFLAAKAVGTKIDQFSIGFGKAIARWTDKSGVEGRIGWLPIGGFVRFAGDENAASVPDQSDLQALISEEYTSELQSLRRISYTVFCLKKNNKAL